MNQQSSVFGKASKLLVRNGKKSIGFNSGKKNNQYFVKIAKTMLFLILSVFVFGLMWFIFHLHNQLQQLKYKVASQIPQQQQSYQLDLTNYTKLNNSKSFSRSFYKSWRTSVINEQNLKKINKIKHLSQNQVEFFSKDSKRKQSYLLSMNNYRLNYFNYTLEKQLGQLLRNQYKRLNKTYDFSLPELPFCVVITSVNNSKDSRYEHNLRSVLNQNYTNFKVVIIDDASGDENAFLIQQLIEEIAPPQKIFLIKNEKNMAKLANFYKAAHEYCSEEDIAFTVDGDDQLLGVNVFKVFNDQYQKHNLQFAYSHAIRSNDNVLIPGHAKFFEIEKQENQGFRRISANKVYNLVSFKVSNFRKIRIEDMKDDKGEWFRCGPQQVIWPPLLELSCGKFRFIDEYLYLNYRVFGNSNFEQKLQCVARTKHIILQRPRYQCASEM